MTAGSKAAEKEARARFRACMDQTLTHVRVGQGSRLDQRIESLGMVKDLHGSVCTCCPRRKKGARR